MNQILKTRIEYLISDWDNNGRGKLQLDPLTELTKPHYSYIIGNLITEKVIESRGSGMTELWLGKDIDYLDIYHAAEEAIDLYRIDTSTRFIGLSQLYAVTADSGGKIDDTVINRLHSFNLADYIDIDPNTQKPIITPIKFTLAFYESLLHILPLEFFENQVLSYGFSSEYSLITYVHVNISYGDEEQAFDVLQKLMNDIVTHNIQLIPSDIEEFNQKFHEIIDFHNVEEDYIPWEEADLEEVYNSAITHVIDPDIEQEPDIFL
jgi:hypothetical protein